MAISGVDPKCYILALFVRDDGVRFLLGDDPFEFKDKQLHFQPNTVANDVVEVQGNDGYLLAGQVRRPGTQMFDGYVCNGTNSKEEVEVKRRAFLQFFRRSHFYKVIYVFPNGTAIQRKQGFLVDDPTVQELYQQYPEYHVALNFEDVNYYTYEEDDQGHEIYAKEAIIKLAGGGATGGLIWDNNGVVWENQWGDIVTVSGVDFQVDNSLPVRVPIEATQLKGDTFQQAYSGAQLFDFTDTTTVSSVYSVDSKGWISCVCDNSTGTGTRYFNYWTNPLALTASTSYALVIEVKSISGTGSIEGGGSNSTSQVGTYNNNFLDMSSGNTYVNPITSKENVSGSNGIRFYLRFNPGNSGSITFRISVLADTSVTPETFVYQPYTGGIPAPNPDYPQTIQVVTGEQTVNISDGVRSEDYTLDLGAIELCKIGTYQDYIYKSGDDWYVHKELSSISFDGSENWNYASGSAQPFRYTITNARQLAQSQSVPPDVYSNYYTPYAWNNSSSVNYGVTASTNSSSLNIICFRNVDITSLANWKTWLSTHNTTIYYPLATATDTKITDATLVRQLEALDAMRLFIGENNILVSASSPNLPATFQFDYFTQYLEPHGAEWEEGGTKGATIVDVDAIDNTYPVWELIGPAINPTISVLTTNTTLTYNGTITASQKLVIDMFNKTATLNGTSVIGNVTGDFVYMAPGTNRVAYTAGNADAPDSKISWQEVVG